MLLLNLRRHLQKPVAETKESFADCFGEGFGTKESLADCSGEGFQTKKSLAEMNREGFASKNSVPHGFREGFHTKNAGRTAQEDNIMPNDYLPGTDLELQAWLTNSVTAQGRMDRIFRIFRMDKIKDKTGSTKYLSFVSLREIRGFNRF